LIVASAVRVAPLLVTERPPVKPSWVDRLIDWIDRLPSPAWVFYLVMYVVAASMLHAAIWIDPVVPVGTLSTTWMVNAIWAVLSVVFIDYLKVAVGRSLDKFAPLVADKPTEFAALRHRMTEMPARPVFWMTVITGLAIVAGIASDPAFAYEGLSHPVSYVLAVSLMVFSYCFTPVVLYLSIRLLASVTRAYGLLDEVDVLSQRPLYAFSRLTLQAGLLWLVIVNLGIGTMVFVGDAGDAQERAISIGFTALGIVIAFTSFLYPLRGC